MGMIAIASVGAKPGHIEDFKAWVAESNRVISQFDGFVSRRLLEAPDGSLRMMVEFQNREQFEAMRQSPEHRRVHTGAKDIRVVHSAPVLYRVIAG